MSSTFRAFVEGKINEDNFTEAFFVFGPHKDNINELSIPSFVMSYNVEKPRWAEEANYVDPNSLDTPVIAQWQKFYQLIKNANMQDRIHWSDGKNYPSKIKPLLESEYEVYWDGSWRKLEEFKYMSDA